MQTLELKTAIRKRARGLNLPSRQRIACTLLLLAVCALIVRTATAQSEDASLKSGIARLQAWYDPATGQYRTTGWWNSANAATALADYARVAETHEYDAVLAQTFTAAQKTSAGFLNDYYDDEGWWALAWIDAYDLTGEGRYLAMADSIFADMAKGWDETCGGGIWWSKERKYKNAIANELFLSVAAQLARRAKDSSESASYRTWAQREWEWFARSGMINDEHLVNDGLDAQCKNNHQTTWTYNQGVILGGLAELNRTTHDAAQLAAAQAIAHAALTSAALVDKSGILHDSCEPDCGGDGTQFKGIFVRNLALLDEVAPATEYETFVRTNAASIRTGMTAPEFGIGVRWAAPYGTVNASTQSSGLDALVAEKRMRQTREQAKTAR